VAYSSTWWVMVASARAPPIPPPADPRPPSHRNHTHHQPANTGWPLTMGSHQHAMQTASHALIPGEQLPFVMSYRSVFRVQEFRSLYNAQTLSLIGDQLAAFAVAVLVFDRTGSGLLIALAYASGWLPGVVGGPFLAPYADRLPRRAVMIVCDIARAILVVVLAWPGMLLAAAITLMYVLQLFSAPFSAARSALMVDVLYGGASSTLRQAGTITVSAVASVSSPCWMSARKQPPTSAEARAADGEVVPRIGETPVDIEDLARRGEFEQRSPVGDSKCNRVHIRNCTGLIVAAACARRP
jgi:hypothetical protein